jgi:hypothetical protein
MPAQDGEADEWIPTFVGMTAMMGDPRPLTFSKLE